MAKAFMNGKNWTQFVIGEKGSATVTLSKMPCETNWYEGRVNGKIQFQSCGKKYSVQNFNKLVERVKNNLN